jgi:hypothetical protein
MSVGTQDARLVAEQVVQRGTPDGLTPDLRREPLFPHPVYIR